MEGEDASATEEWLSKEELDVYVKEWSRTGFQGALNWYRGRTQSTPLLDKDMLLYAGRRLEVPVCFISGSRDWGNFQQPGALQSYDDEAVVSKGCTRSTRFVEDAGHWVQQEKPDEVILELGHFLRDIERPSGV